jgi:D-hexose-6-phosphate mutarotase
MSADYRLAADLPASLTLAKGKGDLPCLRVSSERHGTAEVYLHGAHLAAWQPRGRAPVIFLSRESAFDAARPIRGGVPICFPWFGPHATDKQAPMHGFARIQPWTLTGADDTGEAVSLTFTLGASERTQGSAWPHPFQATYRVWMGPSLQLSLAVRNPGPAPVTFEEALHTYYAVKDVREVSISGLENTEYLDKTDRFARKAQGPSPVRITGETDRIYLATRATCTIDDPGMGRRITVAKQGSDSTVVWNPWIERAKAIADIGDDEWTAFVCVETCNVGDAAVTLAAGAEHTITATITIS